MSQNRNFFSPPVHKPTSCQINAVSLYFTQVLVDGKIDSDTFVRQWKNELNQNNPNWPLDFMHTLDLLLNEENDKGKLSLYHPFTIDYQIIPEVVKTAAKLNNIHTLLFPNKAYISLLEDNIILFDDVKTGKNTKMSAEEYIKTIDRNSLVIQKLHDTIELLAHFANIKLG